MQHNLMVHLTNRFHVAVGKGCTLVNYMYHPEIESK